MTLYKTSNAYIVPQASQRPVWLIESARPEVLLVRELRAFFLEMDVSGVYGGNFSGVRVDTIHPFAMMLFQDITGQKINLDVFPALTVSDTVDNEDYMTLGREHENVVLNEETVAELDGHRQAGRIIVSDAAWARVRSAVVSNNLYGEKGTYRGSHRIDLNIWGENRDVVSEIYEATKLFINTRREYLHENKIDIVGSLDGRPGGDINVEFGVLLHGANITVPCVIETGAMRIELASITTIQSVNTSQVRPEYRTK